MLLSMLQTGTKSAWYYRPEYNVTTEPKLAIFTSYFLVEEDNFPTPCNAAQEKDQCPE